MKFTTNKTYAISMLVGAVISLVLFAMDAEGKAYWWSAFDRWDRFGMTVKFNDDKLQNQRFEILDSAEHAYNRARQLYVVQRLLESGLQAACIGALIGLSVAATYTYARRRSRTTFNSFNYGDTIQ